MLLFLKLYAENQLKEVKPANNKDDHFYDDDDDDLGQDLAPGRKEDEDNQRAGSTSGAALLNDLVQINLITLVMMRN